MKRRSPGRSSGRLLCGLIALACAGGVGAALVSQYRFGMQPCLWCVLQRLIFIVIAVLALIGALAPGHALRRGTAALGGLLALCGGAAALWQHFVAAASASASCNLSLADRIVSGLGLDERWPDVFAAHALCTDAAVSVLGVPYAFWSLTLFILVLAGFLGVLRSR